MYILVLDLLNRIYNTILRPVCMSCTDANESRYNYTMVIVLITFCISFQIGLLQGNIS